MSSAAITKAPTKRIKKAPNATATTPNVHLARLYSYAADILSGKTYVSEYTRLAFQRHQDDLEKAKDPGYAYYFDEAAAERACRFAHRLSHAKGDLAGQPLELHEWALFLFAALFGWKVKGTKTRRFRKVFVFLPRGNSKSTILSAAALYAAFAEGGQADVFSLATTREQAGIVWGMSKTMILRAHDLRERLGVVILAKSLVQAATDSSFRALASEATTLDGLNPSFAIIDELHEVPRELYEVISSAQGKRRNSVMVSISTAGFDSSSFAREQYLYCRQILEGEHQDDLTFGLIYEAPQGSNYYEEKTWAAANPMYGTAVLPEIIAQAAAIAQAQPSSRANFLTKHLNVWVSARSAWMDMDRWDKCYDPALKREDFKGKPCYVGLDLASTSDIAAKALVFPSADANGEKVYTIFVDSFLPESTITSGKNGAYQGWELDGHIIGTPGDVTDYEHIRESIVKDRDAYRIEEVTYDPDDATYLVQKLQEDGLTTVAVRPTVTNYSPAMKEFERAILSGRVRHDGNPALRWMVGNVVTKANAGGQVYPVKENAAAKIDGAVAIITALNRATGAPASPYTPDRGYVFIDFEEED